MAEKDDRESRGNDLNQRHYQFLLVLSSALQFPRMTQSNDTISD